MSAVVLSNARQSAGRTFLIAISLLGAGALGQLAATTWVFLARFQSSPPEVAAAAAAPAVAQVTPEAREFTDPFAEATAVPPLPGPPPAPPRPSPIDAQHLGHVQGAGDPTQSDRMTELIEQGKLLRDRGDTYAAVTKLREAAAIDPQNPGPLAELAMTYEKMGFKEKAEDCWKHVHDMGESAGVFFAAADAKLKASQAEALRRASGNPSDVAASAASGESVGISPASKLGFGDITRTDANDPAVTRKFVLHIPIKAKSHARINVRDLVVQVAFWDKVGGRSLERTTANVSYVWASPPADWSERDIETLEVTYSLPRAPQGEPLDERGYFGYIASIYYKNTLQDFRSEPQRLAQDSPPSATLSQETP